MRRNRRCSSFCFRFAPYLLLIVILVYNIINLRNVNFSNDPCVQPPNFPPSIPLILTNYKNWVGELVVNNLWMAIPSTPNDVVTLANWAYKNNFKLRANGNQRSWSPIAITINTESCGNVMLVDTSNHFTSKSLMLPLSSDINYAIVQTGIFMSDFLLYLEENGYGFYNVPVIDDLTLGGALSVNAHGSSVPAAGETLPPGHLYGSLSNKVINLTAVVWDGNTKQYTLKSFHRSDPESSAFLVQLGRSFITEVTIMVGKNYNMRCISYSNITLEILFANCKTGPTVANLLDRSGRVEVIWLAFTNTPWVRVGTLSPTKPSSSIEVTKPYPYTFLTEVAPGVKAILKSKTKSKGKDTSMYGKVALNHVIAGFMGTRTNDIWGPSKNVMVWYEAAFSTVVDIGFVVQTRRSNIQNVVSTTHSFYQRLIKAYANTGKYPSTWTTVYRFTGLDSSINDSWSIPGISLIRPLKPTFDIAFWFNIELFPNSPYQSEFSTDMQTFLFETFNDDNGMAMVEWSKSWAYTSANGPFTNKTILNSLIPKALKDTWSATVDTLNKYDPNHVFSNSFLDSLLVRH